MFFFGLIACKKDSETPRPPNSDIRNGKLKSISWDNQLKVDFEYNQKGLLIKRIDFDPNLGEITFDFKYNTNNQLIESKISDSEGELNKYVFEYEINRLKKANRLDHTGQLLSYQVYQYNANQQINEILGYIDQFGQIKLNGKFTLVYDGLGNLNELKSFNYNSAKESFELVATYIFENFDDKTRYEFFAWLDPFNPTLDLFKSNPLKVRVLNGLGGTDLTHIYTYEYNQNGKPIKKKIELRGLSNQNFEGEYTYYQK
jgi:hypothetical protein